MRALAKEKQIFSLLIVVLEQV